VADIKQMSFLLLVLLVTVSGVYEWAQAQPVLANDLGVGSVGGFEASTLSGYLSDINISAGNAIETATRLDLLGFMGSLTTVFITTFSIFMKLMFGWADLVGGIFAAVGLGGIDVIFIAPLAIIQLFALFYFLRDLVNTVRGVA
jgi:hypothetical protein